MEKFDPSWNEGGLLEVSSFSTPFRKDREELREYLQEAWPTVKSALEEFGISCELNLEEGSMTVSTTSETRDPYIVVKARDFTTLLAQSVPAPQVLKILDDDMACDIIEIDNLILSRAISDFTGCYILVQGSTVSVMGSLKQVQKIVEACIKSITDPMCHIIQELRELETGL